MKAAKPYESTATFLRDYASLLRLKLEREVELARAQRRQPGSVAEEHASEDESHHSSDAEIAAREDAVHARLAVTSDVLPAWSLAETLGLSPAERDVLLLLQASGLDERFGRVYAYLQEDASRRWLTPGLTWRLLGLDAFSAEANALFAPGSALLENELVRLAAEPGLPLVSRPVVLDERIAAYLIDLDVLDERLKDFLRMEQPGNELCADHLEAAQAASLENLQALWLQGTSSPAWFYGPRGAGKLTAVRRLAGGLSRPLLLADSAFLPQSLPAARAVWRQLRREQRLRGAIVYVRDADRLDDAVRRCLVDEVGPMTVFGSPDGTAFEHSSGLVRLEFALPSQRSRTALWSRDLCTGREKEEGTQDPLADELAGRFRLTPGQISGAASAARRAAALRSGPGALADRDDFFAAARGESTTGLASMAQKVTPAHTWDDLVLPPAVLSRLKAITSQVRNAPLVYEQWRFAANQSYGRGLAALFSGPSGTGKTMSAGVIARSLGLDMYKIDLSRIVSKYIGETEKNLDRVFTEAANANAVLFFDEADALFGKRSEVKDAHDRYANIEISYLLQKMEEYEGLAILATNFGQNLDEAFNRRLAFIVDFPLPRAEDRLAIWRTHMPPAAPVAEDIDFGFLAQQFELTGGAIRNCVRSAAFAAAESGTAITMTHLVQAVAAELAKLGRPLQRTDFGEHFGSVTEARRPKSGVAANGHTPS